MNFDLTLLEFLVSAAIAAFAFAMCFFLGPCEPNNDLCHERIGEPAPRITNDSGAYMPTAESGMTGHSANNACSSDSGDCGGGDGGGD